MGDTCLECRTLISNSVFCECDMCGRKIHSSCANLSISDIKFLRSISKKFLKGLCEQCRDQIHLLPILYKRVQDLEDILENNDIGMDITNYDKLVVDNNGTDLYEEKFNDEIQFLQNKLESLSRENEILSMKSKTSSDKLIELILVLNLLEENKNETNRVIYYLENTLENIKDENNRLKLNLSKKELLIELKNKFDSQTVRKLEKDLQDRNRQVKELIKNQEDMRNKMWNDNQKLIEEHKNIKKYMKKKYNNIRLKYLKEVEKVSLHKQDFYNLNSKYQEINEKHHEQINTNMKFRQDVLYLKNELEYIKNKHKIYKDSLNKLIFEYQLLNATKNNSFDRQILSVDRLEEKLEKKYQENKKKYRITNAGTENCDKLNEVKEQLNGESTFETICDFVYIISECCNELNLSFTKFVERCTRKIQIENEKSPSLRLYKSLEMDHDNLNAVILLLNTLSSYSLTMEGSIKYNQVNPKIEIIEPKAIKKFTLRPSTLHAKVLVTPDSTLSEKEPHIKETLKSDDTSQNCKPFNYNGQGENAVSNSHLPLLSFDLQIQDAFPHISDKILDKLDVLENNPKVKLTKEDTEDLFTTLAVQVAIDSKDIKSRLEKQKEICSQQHRKCIYLLKDVSLRLRDHRCIGATDSINPVFVILEDVRFQMQEMMQAVGQLGVLTCEDRMTKCWNLVTNYMAKSSENLQKKSSPNKLTQRCGKSFNENSMCENVQKQHSSVRDHKGINKCPRTSNWCSRFTHTMAWLSFISMLFLIGLMIVHWQCRMNTISRICPLDDFARILSTNIGNPPY